MGQVGVFLLLDYVFEHADIIGRWKFDGEHLIGGIADNKAIDPEIKSYDWLKCYSEGKVFETYQSQELVGLDEIVSVMKQAFI